MRRTKTPRGVALIDSNYRHDAPRSFCEEHRWRLTDVSCPVCLLNERDKAMEAKDDAYCERNKLVAALSKLFPATLGRHPENEPWDDYWRWIVFIDLPTGQASWHIHDSELPMFSHLATGTVKWDGHSTDEKYRRLESLPQLWERGVAA